MIKRLHNYPLRVRVINNIISIYDDWYGNLSQYNGDEYTVREAKKEYRRERLKQRGIIPAKSILKMLVKKLEDAEQVYNAAYEYQRPFIEKQTQKANAALYW